MPDRPSEFHGDRYPPALQARLDEMAMATDPNTFLEILATAFAEGHQERESWEPVRYNSTTGEPENYGWRSRGRLFTRAHIYLHNSFCRTYALSPAVESFLLRVAEGSPIIYTARNGQVIVVHELHHANSDGHTCSAGVVVEPVKVLNNRVV